MLLARVTVRDEPVVPENFTVLVADDVPFVIERLNAGLAGATTTNCTSLNGFPPGGLKRPEAEMTLQPDWLVDAAVTGNVAESCPGAMATVVGTVATAGTLLVRFADKPPAGAFPLSETVPVTLPPGEVFAAERLSCDNDGGIMEKDLDTKPAADIPPVLRITFTAEETGLVLKTKEAFAWPAGTMTGSGVIGFGGILEASALFNCLEMLTDVPPEGAVAFKVTLPFTGCPPTTEL